MAFLAHVRYRLTFDPVLKLPRSHFSIGPNLKAPRAILVPDHDTTWY